MAKNTKGGRLGSLGDRAEAIATGGVEAEVDVARRDSRAHTVAAAHG